MSQQTGNGSARHHHHHQSRTRSASQFVVSRAASRQTSQHRTRTRGRISVLTGESQCEEEAANPFITTRVESESKKKKIASKYQPSAHSPSQSLLIVVIIAACQGKHKVVKYLTRAKDCCDSVDSGCAARGNVFALRGNEEDFGSRTPLPHPEGK